MRAILMFLATLVFASSSALGGRIFDATGRMPSIVDEAYAFLPDEIPPTPAPDAQPRSLVMMTKRLADFTRRVLADELQEDSTTLQQQEHNSSRILKLNNEVTPCLGQYVRATFFVEDVVARPQPSVSSSAESTSELERWKEQKILVVGRIEEGGKAAAELSDDQKQRVAGINSALRFELARLDARIKAAEKDVDKDRARGEKVAATAKARNSIAAIRKSALKLTPVGHAVYILGTDDQFKQWRKQQRRSVLGIITRIGVFTPSAPPPVTTSGKPQVAGPKQHGVQIETVLHLVKDEGTQLIATSEPSTQPGDDSATGDSQ